MPRTLVPILAPVRSPAAAGAFAPTDVAGLELWLRGDAGTFQDAARTTAAAADGDPVGGWRDDSGGAHHFSQATAAKRGTLKTGANGINGRSIVRFDGVDDYLSGPALSTLISASAFCGYVVVKLAGATTNNVNTYNNQAIVCDGVAAFWGLFAKSAGPDVVAYNWDGNDDNVSRVAATGSVYGVRWRHTGGNLYILRSGVGETFTPSGDTTTRTGTVEIARGNALLHLPFDLAELLIYHADPTAGERASLETYLAGRWGITW